VNNGAPAAARHHGGVSVFHADDACISFPRPARRAAAPAAGRSARIASVSARGAEAKAAGAPAPAVPRAPFAPPA